MCSSPSEMQRDNIMELAVKYSEWPPANWLHRRAQVGNRVSLRVGGDFHYPDKDTKAKGNHDLLLVAGGVGINPLASIIFHVGDLAVGGNAFFRLVGSQGDVVLHYLQGMKKPRVKKCICCIRPKPRMSSYSPES